MIKETLLSGKRGMHWMGLQFPLSEKQNWKQFQKQNSEKCLGIKSHWSSKSLSDVQTSCPLLSNEIPRDDAMAIVLVTYSQSLTPFTFLVSCWDHSSSTWDEILDVQSHIRLLGASYDPSPYCTSHLSYPSHPDLLPSNYTGETGCFSPEPGLILLMCPGPDPFSVFCLLVLPNHHPSLSTGSFSSTYQYSQVFPIQSPYWKRRVLNLGCLVTSDTQEW